MAVRRMIAFLEGEPFFEYPINDMELASALPMAFTEFGRLVPEVSVFDERLSFKFVEDDASISAADLPA